MDLKSLEGCFMVRESALTLLDLLNTPNKHTQKLKIKTNKNSYKFKSNFKLNHVVGKVITLAFGENLYTKCKE